MQCRANLSTEGQPAGKDATDFVGAFVAKHGRKPRVLHLGNIANNAYHNAKLMRAAGAECDVVSYDYYHVMACPEWEDADFDTSPPEHFGPDWTKVQLHGYTRPRWFVQGPERLCIRYLMAKIHGNHARAELFWRALALANRTRRPANPFELVVLWLILAHDKMSELGSRIVAHSDPWAAIGRGLRPVSARIGRSATTALGGLIFALVVAMRAISRTLKALSGQAEVFRVRTLSIVRMYDNEFPDRPDKFEIPDVERYQRKAEKWLPLFRAYDIVQAYATDVIFPFLCGQSYFAFEHGTLREIPFERSALGRMTALGYRRARHVFVTNADCLQNAAYLAGERVSFINHPFDENVTTNTSMARKERGALQERLQSSFIFFFPTRHDWTRPGADKANDVFLRAFCRLRNSGQRVGLVCCDWGGDVAASKALLADQGCTSAVHWVPPMGIVRFGHTALVCDIVVDQFRIGAFGGVMFKSFAFGAPVMTYLDEAAIRRVFDDPPPVVNCRTEDEIVRASEKLLREPRQLERLAQSSHAWLLAHHRGAITASLQLGQYQRSLS